MSKEGVKRFVGFSKFCFYLLILSLFLIAGYTALKHMSWSPISETSGWQCIEYTNRTNILQGGMLIQLGDNATTNDLLQLIERMSIEDMPIDMNSLVCSYQGSEKTLDINGTHILDSWHCSFNYIHTYEACVREGSSCKMMNGQPVYQQVCNVAREQRLSVDCTDRIGVGWSYVDGISGNLTSEELNKLWSSCLESGWTPSVSHTSVCPKNNYTTIPSCREYRDV